MFVNPQRIMDKAAILPGMTGADFGAGAGFYSIELARRVGGSGKVYAIDIRREMLELVRSKARATGLSNIEAIWGDLELLQGSHLRENSVDIAVISNVLFQVSEKEALAKEAFRIVKPGGKALVVEWNEKGALAGPRSQERLPKHLCRELFINVGFRLDEEFEAGEHHYGFLFKKP